MSFKQLNNVWEHSPYSANMMLFHIGLAEESNSEGDFALTHKMMGSKTKISVPTVKRYLAAMIEDGMIEITHQGGSYRGDYSRYRLLWPEGVPTGYAEYDGIELGDSEVDTDSIKGFTAMTPIVDTESIKQVTAMTPLEVDTQSIKGFTGELQSNKTSNTNNTNLCSSMSACSTKKPMTSAELIAARKTKPAKPKPVKEKTPPNAETLMAQQLLRDRWDAEKESTGKDPLWSFPGVLLIIKGYIKGGHTQEDIEYLLENTPVYTKNAFQLCLSQRGKTPGGRAQVEQAMSALDQLGQQKKSRDFPTTRDISGIIEVDEATQGELT